MTSVISQRKLRNESGEIMRRLDQGETFIVTRNGQPVGRLIPLRRERLVRREAILETFKGAPRIDIHELRKDLAEDLDDSLVWDE